MLAFILQAAATLPPPANNLPRKTPDALAAPEAAAKVQAGSLFPDKNLTLTMIILSFALLAMVVLYLMCRSDRREEFELRIFTIMILVFGSLLVVAAGFGEDTLTPVIGFFGTIAGYVLGRGDAEGRNKTRLLEDRSNRLLLDDQRNENS